MQISGIQSNTNFKGLMVFGEKCAVNTKHIETIAPCTTSLGEKAVFIKTRSKVLCFDIPKNYEMSDVYKAYSKATLHDGNIVYISKDDDKCANYII